MKGRWVAVATAAVLMGCRSAQPTTNPFLRTTVPPPATGAAVVTPGTPYDPAMVPVTSGAPQAVATPAVPITQPAAPLVTTPAAPVVAPAIVTPPAQPPVIPPRDKYSPPGGSFQYNQSSKEAKPSNQVVQAGATAPLAVDVAAVAAAAALPAKAGRESTANRGDVVTASFREPTTGTAGESPDTHGANEPPRTLATNSGATRLSAGRMSVGGNAAENANEIRIVGPAEEGAEAPEPAEVAASPVFRVTVGDDDAASGKSPTFRVRARPAGGAESQVAIVTSATLSDTLAAQDAGQQPPDSDQQTAAHHAVAQAAADYAFADDYAWLRGRLEFSESTRQWKLRYIPIDGPTDDYGGSVVLSDSAALRSFHPGDQVAARGSLAGKSPTTGSFSPLYLLESIEPLTR